MSAWFVSLPPCFHVCPGAQCASRTLVISMPRASSPVVVGWGWSGRRENAALACSRGYRAVGRRGVRSSATPSERSSERASEPRDRSSHRRGASRDEQLRGHPPDTGQGGPDRRRIRRVLPTPYHCLHACSALRATRKVRPRGTTREMGCGFISFSFFLFCTDGARSLGLNELVIFARSSVLPWRSSRLFAHLHCVFFEGSRCLDGSHSAWEARLFFIALLCFSQTCENSFLGNMALYCCV